MRAYIKKLQSKPEHIRKQILVGSLIVSMSFVFLVWISGIGNKFDKYDTAKEEESIKPFALLGKTISSTYNNITASVGNISSTIKEDELKKEEKIELQKQIELIPIEYN